MSRFERALPEEGLLIVGWDPPLQSFYGQVFPAGAMARCQDPNCWNKDVSHVRRDCYEDEDHPWPEPWVGCSFEELPTVERLEEALGEYGGHLGPMGLKVSLHWAKAKNE
jgi:hypothetical protein